MKYSKKYTILPDGFNISKNNNLAKKSNKSQRLVIDPVAQIHYRKYVQNKINGIGSTKSTGSVHKYTSKYFNKNFVPGITSNKYKYYYQYNQSCNSQKLRGNERVSKICFICNINPVAAIIPKKYRDEIAAINLKKHYRCNQFQTKYFCTSLTCLNTLDDWFKDIMLVPKHISNLCLLPKCNTPTSKQPCIHISKPIMITVRDYLEKPLVYNSPHKCFICNTTKAVMRLTNIVTNENRHILREYNNVQYLKYDRLLFCDRWECLKCVDPNHYSLFTHVYTGLTIKPNM